MEPPFERYQRAILQAWHELPCTRGSSPRTDRRVLLDLYRRNVSLPLVLAALRLGCARRSPDLPPVRSVAYFRPVIHELADADPSYVAHLAHALTR